MSSEDFSNFSNFLDRKEECKSIDELLSLIDEAITSIDSIRYELKDMASSYDESNPKRAAAIQLLFERLSKKLYLKYNSILTKAKEFSKDNKIISSATTLDSDKVEHEALYQVLSGGELFTDVVKPRMERLKAVLQGNNKITSIDKSDGCYIATATMGDFDDPVVVALREFRDNYLQYSTLGRIFIALYYRFSPPLARLIEDSTLLKRFSYWLIVRPAYVFAQFFRHTT